MDFAIESMFCKVFRCGDGGDGKSPFSHSRPIAFDSRDSNSARP